MTKGEKRWKRTINALGLKGQAESRKQRTYLMALCGKSHRLVRLRIRELGSEAGRNFAGKGGGIFGNNERDWSSGKKTVPKKTIGRKRTYPLVTIGLARNSRGGVKNVGGVWEKKNLAHSIQ